MFTFLLCCLGDKLNIIDFFLLVKNILGLCRKIKIKIKIKKAEVHSAFFTYHKLILFAF